MNAMFGGFSFIVVIFLIVLAVLWFLLPFAVFGVKDKLCELIKETKETNRLLMLKINQESSLSGDNVNDANKVEAKVQKELTEKELMKKYNITFYDGGYVFDKYTENECSYDKLIDAVNYAKKQL